MSKIIAIVHLNNNIEDYDMAVWVDWKWLIMISLSIFLIIIGGLMQIGRKL